MNSLQNTNLHFINQPDSKHSQNKSKISESNAEISQISQENLRFQDKPETHKKSWSISFEIPKLLKVAFFLWLAQGLSQTFAKPQTQAQVLDPLISCSSLYNTVKDTFSDAYDLNAIDNYGNHFMHIAANHEDFECMHSLLYTDPLSMNVPNGEGETPFHIAVKNGNKKAVKIFLSVNVNVDIQDNEGNTPLHWAILRGHIDIVRLLLEAGANSNIQNKEGNTAIHLAVLNTKCLKLLIQVQSLLLMDSNSLDVQNKNGFTSLHLAVQGSYSEAVKLLLGVDNNFLLFTEADVNAKDLAGNTPLHWAARKGNREIMQMLINKGAKKNDDNHIGDTPFIWGLRKGHLDMILKLKKQKRNFAKIDNKFEEFFQKINEINESFLDLRGRFKTKRLAHIWEIDGIKQEERQTIDLEGEYTSSVAHYMSNIFDQFRNAFPGRLKDEQLDQLVNALKNVEMFSADRAFMEYQLLGKPVIIPSGRDTHAISVVFIDSYMIICNKGEGSLRPIEAFQIDQNEVTEEILTKISLLKFTDSIKHFDKLFGERIGGLNIRKDGPLLLQLKAKRNVGFCNYFENLRHNTKEQVVGNCAYESLETAIYSIIAYQKSSQEGSHNEEILKTETYDIFNLWDQFSKLSSLQGYLAEYCDQIASQDSILKKIFEIGDQIKWSQEKNIEKMSMTDNYQEMKKFFELATKIK